MRPDQVWQAALCELQIQLTKSTFDTWLRGTILLSHDGEANVFVVGVENAYGKDWLENRLLSALRRTLTGIVGRAADVQLVVWKDDDSSADDDTDSAPETRPAGRAGEPEDEPPKLPDWNKIGVPRILADESLVTLDWSAPALQKPELREYFARAPGYLDGGMGLTLIGSCGVGKSHIAVALLKLAHADGMQVRFLETGDMLDQLKRLYDARQSDGDFLFPLRDVDVLALDDLGDVAAPWGWEKVGWILRRRHSRGRPTLVTSNLTLDELADRGLDGAAVERLAYSSVVITLAGRSYRAIRKRQTLTAARAVPVLTRSVSKDGLTQHKE